MRKVNPNDVRRDFVNEIDEFTGYLNRARRGLENEGRSEADISRLMSTSFLTLYVTFERFTSDLFLAYLNGSSSKYQRWQGKRISDSVASKFGVWTSTRTKFEMTEHLSVLEVENALNADGYNLTFKSAGEMRLRAGEWLATAPAARISGLTAHDERLLDTAKSIRDFIAHDSPSSKRRMNDALSTVAQDNANQHLGRGTNLVHGVGVYLKAVYGGQRRIALYANRLREISQQM